MSARDTHRENSRTAECALQWMRGARAEAALTAEVGRLLRVRRRKPAALFAVAGEADFYESLNSAHQVTEHFHEFAMGLQADAAGNLYSAKSARHARTALVPQHGTVLKVSTDGTKTEILANDFRAANGVCLKPDGSIIVTDQEGHWMPMSRINWVKPGTPRFYGNMWSYGAPADTSDAAMEPPLTWVYKQFDRSLAELLWVESPAWGALNGRLLNLSYGTGRIELVPHETAGGTVQGGLVALPIPDFPTGVMRGHFHPSNGSPRSNVKTLAVVSARLSADGKSLRLALPKIAPTHRIELSYTLRTTAGAPVNGTFQGTIHALGETAP